jgi:amino-acid N-acetyltransferase
MAKAVHQTIELQLSVVAQPQPAHIKMPVVRPARVGDVPQLYRLIADYAQRGLMLPKTEAQLYHNVRDFMVADADGKIVGCAGLKVTWHDLAEIISLAVSPEYQGRGIGRQLVTPLIEEARRIGIPTVFALTYQIAFFRKLGFQIVPKHNLSQKVWQDCVICPKQDCCDETAMIRILTNDQRPTTTDEAAPMAIDDVPVIGEGYVHS